MLQNVQADFNETNVNADGYIKNANKKLDTPTGAGTVGQVLQKTSNGTEWADAVDADTITAINNLSTMLDSHIGAADSTNYFCIVATRNGQAISVGNDGQWATGTVLEYSIDKTNWFEFDPTTTAKAVLLNTGMKMYLRGDNNRDVIPSGKHPFQGDWILDGDMKSLWSKTLEPEYAITSTYNWFSNSSILGFGANFAFPSFDSVTNMQGMFSGCTSLVSLPSGFTIPSSVTNCSNMFSNCTNLVSLPSGFSIPSSVTNCSSMFSGSLKGGEIPAPPANTTNLNWYAAFGGGTSNPSTLAAGWKVPDGCTQCSYALHSRGLTSLPDGFQIPASITDDGRAFNGGGNAVTTFGNNVSFLKQNASWHNDYIQCDTVTTIGNNFTLMCDNAPSTDPYVCFPHLTSLGTNCNINGTITNPA